jgi:hypothetical protein
MLPVLASAVIPRSESRTTHNHILLSQIRDFLNLEDQVPGFISPRKMVARLYTQVVDSIFVASYDSQGYGLGIRTRLHTGPIPRPSETALSSATLHTLFLFSIRLVGYMRYWVLAVCSVLRASQLELTSCLPLHSCLLQSPKFRHTDCSACHLPSPCFFFCLAYSSTI